jgi:hypothetical protein
MMMMMMMILYNGHDCDDGCEKIGRDHEVLKNENAS